ncbi:MAG: hybrid sensor histidine kinase/response regulator [Bdellovibrionota bacterium]
MEGARPYSILIVDDETSVLRMLDALLRRDRHQVLTAESAEQALAVLAEEPADLILTDNMLPGMLGTELLDHVREKYPDMIRLLMTAEPNTEALAQAINKGHVFRYIEKPFTPQAVREAIHAAVRHLEILSENKRLQELTEQQNKMLWDLTYDLELKIQERTAQVESQKRMIEESHQRLIELTSQRGDMLLILAHELNTPLAVLRGFVSLFEENNLTWSAEKRLQVLGVLRDSLERLDRNTGSILQALESGHENIPLQLERFDLREVVRDSSRDAQPLIERRKHVFTLNIGPEPLPVEGERRLIRNALDNLILNAIRFTPDGGRITVTTRGKAPIAQVLVRDTGIGIAKEEHERIFEPFYEGRSPMHHSSGTIEFGSGSLGLGLHVSRSIVDRHGGKILLESEVGKGSTFTLELPAAPA